MSSIADDTFPRLTLELRPDGTAFRARLKLQMSGAVEPADFTPDVLAAINTTMLRAHTGDIERYGRLLSEMVFVAEMREAWARACGHADGAGRPLRCRLQLETDDDALHSLRWELLHTPPLHKRPSQPLALTENRLLARTVTSGASAPVASRPYAELRALIAVANPTNLSTFNLSPINALAEAERAERALSPIPAVRLGGGLSDRRLTLPALDSALRAGVDILYLVCHGKIVDGVSHLALEGDTGKCEWVEGQALVKLIAGLQHRPTLVVLASCESAGAGGHSTAGALGPRLVAAGAGAVVAMQGLASFALVARFTPAFLQALLRDGDIERAMAAGRGALRDDDNWWQPALFSQLQDGHLWPRPALSAQELAAQQQARELVSKISAHPSPAGRIMAAVELAALGDPRLGVCSQQPAWATAIPASTYPIRAAERRVGSGLRRVSAEPEARLALGRFRVARHPTTVWQYRQFIEADGYKEERWWTREGLSWLHDREITHPREWDYELRVVGRSLLAKWGLDPHFENRPVVNVSWYEATAFCAWLEAQGRAAGWVAPGERLRLPTEAEWEVAAAWDATAGAIRQWVPERMEAAAREVLPQGWDNFPPPVGCFPQRPSAAYDMAGGVWEWCASAYDAYPKGANLLISDFSRAPSEGARPVQRGSSFREKADGVGWFARRRAEAPGETRRNLGFRVVLSELAADGGQ